MPVRGEIGISVAIPHWVATYDPGELLVRINQIPLLGLQTEMSVFPSPS
jgi:hypothetical protein